MKKATISLWYDGQAIEAVKYYARIFKGTKIKKITRYPKNMPDVGGKVVAVYFTMLGVDFVGINGGAEFKFNPSFSITVNCKTQKEVDNYWSKLLADGGKEMACGWLSDKFGMSWQVVPEILPRYLNDKNQTKAAAVMAAMMQMIKLDIAALKAAYKSVGRN